MSVTVNQRTGCWTFTEDSPTSEELFTKFRGSVPHGSTLENICTNSECRNPDHKRPVRTVKSEVLVPEVPAEKPAPVKRGPGRPRKVQAK